MNNHNFQHVKLADYIYNPSFEQNLSHLLAKNIHLHCLEHQVSPSVLSVEFAGASSAGVWEGVLSS